MVHMHLDSGQAGVSVQLTVVAVRLPIAATHCPLVGLTELMTDHTYSTVDPTYTYNYTHIHYTEPVD